MIQHIKVKGSGFDIILFVFIFWLELNEVFLMSLR